MEDIYRKRRSFAIAFLISTGVFVVLYLITRKVTPPDLLEGPPFQPVDPDSNDSYITILLALIGLAGSCLTSIVTLAGTISTTLIALRRESREDRLVDAEIRRKEMELRKEEARQEKDNKG